MALKSNQPIVDGDKVYENYAVNLVMSPVWKSDGMGVSIIIQLTPYRIDENGSEHLDNEAKAIVYSDATVDATNDPDLAEFLREIERAGQKFIDVKGF